MKVVKALFKAIWWIIKIPILPLSLGWKWAGKQWGHEFVRGDKMPGLGRLICAAFYAMLLYMLLVPVAYIVVIGGIMVAGTISSSIRPSTGTADQEPAPVVEQVSNPQAGDQSK